MKTLVVLALFISALSFAKKHGPWEAVEIVDEKPKDCQFIGDIDTESKRWFFTTSNHSLNKKNKIRLQKKASKMGGDTLWITSHDTTMINSSAEGKVYLCKKEKSEE